MKMNYAFDMTASVESGKDFDSIPLADKISAMRKRLDNIEAENNSEAFGECDAYEVEDSTPPPMVGQRYRDDSICGYNEEFFLACLPHNGGRKKEYILINIYTGTPYTDPADTMIDAFGGDRDDFTLVSN